MTALTAILTVPIPQKELAPALDDAQRDADLAAVADQARASGVSFVDQRDRIAPMRGASPAPP